MACAQTALIQPDTSIAVRRKVILNVVWYSKKKAALVSGFFILGCSDDLPNHLAF